MSDVRPLAAALSILAAMAIIGLIDNFVALIAETSSLWQFHVFRTAMMLVMLGAVVLMRGLTLRPKRPRAVLLRTAFVSTAMIIYFGALGLLPITQAIAGLFTSPLFVLLISLVFMGEPATPARLLAAPIGFLGVLLVLQPWADGTSPLVLFATLSGLFYAIGAIVTRRRCQAEGTMTLVAAMFLAMGVWGLLGMGLMTLLSPVAPPGPGGFLLRGYVAPDSTFLTWTLVQAVGSLVAVTLLTRAYQIGETSFVAVFEYSVLIFAAIWALVLYGTRPDSLELSGIALIILAGGLLAAGNRRRVIA